jgi:DNA (cytosine-5)-methyltransferase 1
MELTFGSLFSGIEAASSAWHPLGWEPAWYAEVDPFCCELLKQRWPGVPNLGDVTADDFANRAKSLGHIDLVVGGSPCQSFSLAGLRKGLDDERGNLALRYVQLCNELDPDWVVWENVPGVLSDKTNAFGCLLAGLAGESTPLTAPRASGGRWPDAGWVCGPHRTLAFRVLDAQWYGLAQRRRRVFIVGGRAGARANPLVVLLEPESPGRDSAPRRPEKPQAAGVAGAGVAGGSGGTGGVVNALRAGSGGGCGPDDNSAQAGHLAPVFSTSGQGFWREGVVSLRGREQDSHELLAVAVGEPLPVQDTATARRSRCPGDVDSDATSTLVPMAFNARQDPDVSGCVSHPLGAKDNGHGVLVAAFGGNNTSGSIEVATACNAKGGSGRMDFETETFVVEQSHLGDCANSIQASAGHHGHSSPRGDGSDNLVVAPVALMVHGENSTAMCGGGSATRAEPCDITRTLDTNGGYAASQGGNVVLCPEIAQPLRGNVYNNSDAGMEAAQHIVVEQPLPFDTTQVTSKYNYSSPKPGDPAPSLGLSHPPAVAYQCHVSNVGPMGALRAGNGNEAGGVPFMAVQVPVRPVIAGSREWFAQEDVPDAVGLQMNYIRETQMRDVSVPLTSEPNLSQFNGVFDRTRLAVRRLTPVECERLQGFPDGHTAISWRGKPPEQCPDGSRYRSLGNSIAVPVLRWIGERIQLVLLACEMTDQPNGADA